MPDSDIGLTKRENNNFGHATKANTTPHPSKQVEPTANPKDVDLHPQSKRADHLPNVSNDADLPLENLGSTPNETKNQNDHLQLLMERLDKKFSEKILVDTKKDQIINNLHTELQNYKDDFVGKLIKPLLQDLIQLIDSYTRLLLSNQPEETEVKEPKFQAYKEVVQDLEDMLLLNVVEPFVSQEDQFNAKTMRVLKSIATVSPQKAKQVSERVRPGYIWEGTLLRRELVNVYKYKPNELKDEPMQKMHESKPQAEEISE